LASYQLIEQHFGILPDRRVEGFGESTVDWREESTGFGVLALIMPEAGETAGGPKFPERGALPLCNRERLMITLLGRGAVAHGVQQIASQPMHVSLAAPLLGRLDHLRSLGEAIQSFNPLAEHSAGFGEPCEVH